MRQDGSEQLFGYHESVSCFDKKRHDPEGNVGAAAAFGGCVIWEELPDYWNTSDTTNPLRPSRSGSNITASSLVPCRTRKRRSEMTNHGPDAGPIRYTDVAQGSRITFLLQRDGAAATLIGCGVLLRFIGAQCSIAGISHTLRNTA